MGKKPVKGGGTYGGKAAGGGTFNNCIPAGKKKNSPRCRGKRTGTSENFLSGTLRLTVKRNKIG